MRTWEMDIFEEMDYIIDKFFTDLDNTVIYTEEEPEEAPQDEDEEEEEEPDEEEEDDAWEAFTSWERHATLSGFLGGTY